MVSKIALCLVFSSFLACGGGSSAPTAVQPPTVNDPEPETFHCNKDSSCPEILIAGAPHVTEAFRGYGDPSLEFDESTNTLWLAYSWLNILISDPGPPAKFDLGVRTHLAKSTDGGNTFEFVREVNIPEIESHPDTGVQGWSIHEVPTLLKQSDESWQLLWFKYFNPLGTVAGVDERQEFLYWRTQLDMPENLGDNNEVWARAAGASTSWNAPIDLNDIAEISDCTVMTEPALFALNDENYLASSCLVVDPSGRRTDLERLVLLRENNNGYEFVGTILDSSDAANLGVDVIQQADISVARDGGIVMIVTPIILGNNPDHQGCIVYEFDDFATASIKRGSNGQALARNVITADGNGLGPGLCTYDAASDSGILLVIVTVSLNGADVEFSLRATGVHP